MHPVDFSLSHHAPSEAQAKRIEKLRVAAKVFGAAIEETMPTRERSLALTNLEQSLMWAIKGIILE